jgi:hypothetical protein
VLEFGAAIAPCSAYLNDNATCRKMDDRPVDEDLRSALRAICTEMMSALNKYYSFGSVFAEDI